MNEPLRVLVVGMPRLAASAGPSSSPGDGFEVEFHDTLVAASAVVAAAGDARDVAAVVVEGGLAAAASAVAEVERLVARAALVVVLLDPDDEDAGEWLQRGAQDVVSPDELAGDAGWRRIGFAVERWRRARGRESAYATDPATRLPHRQQLNEHLSQLLALREREPAPMAVLALRIEGLDGAGEPEAQNTLLRKIAVRLRAGVRASDVVAALDDGSFAVLLVSLLSPADAERVTAKLVAALVAPFQVGGREIEVAVATGTSRFPQDGKAADKLLRRAVALAAAAPAGNLAAARHARDAHGRDRAAANDDG